MIRDTTPSDFPAILRLNAEYEHFLSPLDHDRLARLHAQSSYHRVIQIDAEPAAVLLAFGEGSAYDGVNYRWFHERFDRFLYIDRIIVSANHQRKHLASTLYRDVFDFARENAIESVACEFNISPPNEASRRFHASFGFREVGTQWIDGGKKQVSMQVASSGHAGPSR
jgi:predicted GNAT superfamily acetyltransferase